MVHSPPQPAENNFFYWERIEKANPVLLVAAPALVLLIQALPHLARGYRVDDIFSVVASRSWSGMFNLFRDYENNMALFQVILYFWMKLFGEGEAATHSLSLLAAVITIPVFFRLERFWLNRTSAFFGALLLSVSPRFVHQSVETRSYAMLILSVTVSTWMYMRWLRKPEYARALIYGLSVGIGCYLHYFGVLIVLAHVFTFTRKTFTRPWLPQCLFAGLVAVIVISPLFLFPPHDKTQVNGSFPPGIMDLWYVFSACFATGYIFVFLAACLFFVARAELWKSAAVWQAEAVKLAAAWAFVPVLLMWLFSRYVSPLFLPRYFVWVVPGVALLIAIVLSYTGRNRLVKTGLWMLVLGIFVAKTSALFRTIGEGYRDPVAYFQARVKPGEAVICYPYYWTIDINFYLDKMKSGLPAARPVNIAGGPYLAGGGGVDPEPDYALLKKTSGAANRVFLFSEGSPGLSKGDSIQHRIWLSSIQQTLARDHLKVTEIMFDGQTQTPIRLQIYERPLVVNR